MVLFFVTHLQFSELNIIRWLITECFSWILKRFGWLVLTHLIISSRCSSRHPIPSSDMNNCKEYTKRWMYLRLLICRVTNFEPNIGVYNLTWQIKLCTSWQHCVQLRFSGCCVIRDMLWLFSVMEVVFLILFPIQLSVMTTPINTYSYSIPAIMAHKLNGRVNHIECDVEASLVFGL